MTILVVRSTKDALNSHSPSNPEAPCPAISSDSLGTYKEQE